MLIIVTKEDDGPESLTWENEWFQTDQVCFSNVHISYRVLKTAAFQSPSSNRSSATYPGRLPRGWFLVSLLPYFKSPSISSYTVSANKP